jgi:hypothetical protein
MTYAQMLAAEALLVADELGRDWTDCGEYERESFRDEARRRLVERSATDKPTHDAIRDELIAYNK